MQISVEISGEVEQEAASRGVLVKAFVETLIDRGMESIRDRASVSSAVERIRALRRPMVGTTALLSPHPEV